MLGALFFVLPRGADDDEVMINDDIDSTPFVILVQQSGAK